MPDLPLTKEPRKPSLWSSRSRTATVAGLCKTLTAAVSISRWRMASGSRAGGTRCERCVSSTGFAEIPHGAIDRYGQFMTLDSLAERYWLAYSEYNPTVATTRGEHEFDDRLRRFDDEWLAEMTATFESITEDALALDASKLGAQERISLDLLIHETRVWATEISQRFLVAAIDPYLGPHTRLLSDTRQNTVTSVDQADALLGRYAKVPQFLDGALRLHLANASAGMTSALASVERVIGQLDGYLGSDLEDDPFLQLKVPGGGEDWLERASALV